MRKANIKDLEYVREDVRPAESLKSVYSRYILRIPAFRIDTANLLPRLAAMYDVPEKDLCYEWDGVRIRQDWYPSGYYVVRCKSDWTPQNVTLTKEIIQSLRLPRASETAGEIESAGVSGTPGPSGSRGSSETAGPSGTRGPSGSS